MSWPLLPCNTFPKDWKLLSIYVMVDTSNHKSLKLVPVLVRYFIPRKGVQTKVIEFHNLKGEIADMLTTYNGCTG
jgi:hypothetical protein